MILQESVSRHHHMCNGVSLRYHWEKHHDLAGAYVHIRGALCSKCVGDVALVSSI
jgi:hypothetical protein